LLESAALASVETEDEQPRVTLARAVLRTMPALGILLARGALQTENMRDGNILLDDIEVARDQLLLAPDDPAQQIFEALGGVRNQRAAADAEHARLSRTTANLRANLDQAAARIDELQRQVADRERELTHADGVRAAAHGATEPPAAERERRMLRDKIDALQAGIRERNEERAKLRRELADAIDSKTTAPSAPSMPSVPGASDQAEEGMEALSALGTARRVLLPRFGATAAAAFETVPGNVAANAMRAIGALAAGDAAAWRSVKQGKDMSRQVLMQRIGIHHRLLFRTDEGGFDILDLVTRESLQATLKRLRST
jgi:hypothetical protein